MKNILKIFFVLLFAISCKDASKSKGSEEGATNEATDVNEMNNGKKDNLLKELAKKTPLTSEQLKAAFPKNIKDLQLDKEPVVNGQTISGHFGGRKITMGITDSAGDNYLRTSYFLDALNDENFVNTADTKHIKKERDGVQTFTKYYVGSHTELEFLYQNRFLVHLVSEMTPDELWDAFDINALQSYKNLN
ncbi:MAG: hypothetical protein ACSHXF_00700 [Aquaticitalea sp.]